MLKRNEVKADHPEKYAFRKRNIENNYELFEEQSYQIPLAQTNIIHLDGEQSPNKIFKEVMKEIKKYGANNNV